MLNWKSYSIKEKLEVIVWLSRDESQARVSSNICLPESNMGVNVHLMISVFYLVR